jgi:hypothetical protein
MRRTLLLMPVIVALLAIAFGTPLGLLLSQDAETQRWISLPSLIVASLAAFAWVVYAFYLLARWDADNLGRAGGWLFGCLLAAGFGSQIVLGILALAGVHVAWW